MQRHTSWVDNSVLCLLSCIPMHTLESHYLPQQFPSILPFSLEGDVRSAFLQTELMCSDLPDPRVRVRGKPASCGDLISLCQRQDPVGLRIQTSCPHSCKLCPAGTQKNQWSKCFPEQCSSGGLWQTQDEDGMFTINYVTWQHVTACLVTILYLVVADSYSVGYN